MISIEHLTYFYPDRPVPALRDVSLRVRPGEFVLLAGPSGAGKSTLLRCLNGLSPHFSGGRISGRVQVAGLDPLVAGPRALSRHVGFVFQDPERQAVLDRVESEIAFGLEQHAIPPQEMRLRIEEVLHLLGLDDLRDRALVTLSGGERQRVAIATALVLRPPILALDEPTSQLDPQSSEEVLQALVRLNEDLGLTIILAEHRLERVLRYADRLVYMDQGRISADGPVREALALVPQQPPLARLALALGWKPLPLTVKEARRFVSGLDLPAPRTGLLISAATSPPVLLEARDVRFAYGSEPALRGVSLQVRPGESVALLGRNGAGKSTLLKCLVGLLRPQQGEVYLNGRTTRGMPVADIARRVAYLPQNPDDLLFADTVEEELWTTIRHHGLQNGTLDPYDMLRELGLTGLGAAYPRDLAVGQRQRVALGAMMITTPGVLLLDEPTRGLDYDAKGALVALWERWRAAGMGLLIVTHDVEFAARVAGRVVVISQGEIIADGPARDILAASPLFAPQVARLFPGQHWLTPDDALAGFAQS